MLWSKFRFLRDCFMALVFFNLWSSVNHGGRHFYSLPPPTTTTTTIKKLPTALWRYCKGIVANLFLVLWSCLATHTQSYTIILWKTFVCIYRQKINLISHAFMKILQRYASACLDNMNFQKTTMFISMAKNKLHHSPLS